MSSCVDLHLTNDEAIVLFEFFARFQESEPCRLRIANNAEFVALSRISAQLDKALVEPFDTRYVELLEEARERIAAGYEGLAPGVEP